DVEPTEIAYVAEKEDKTKSWIVESFDSMVRTTECLHRLVSTTPEDNNQNVKRFPGGSLHALWATSPAELSSRPKQIMLFDEKAAYQPTKEGDAVKLGEARTKTYDGFEKIGKISSPRNSGDDADIEADFLRGDKRQYWVPCPSCDAMQLLEWKNCHWDDGDADTAYMVCVECGVQLEYDDLQEMLERGRWIKDADLDKPFWPDHAADPEVASFKINQLYSPFVRWSRMVKDFLEAKKKGPGSTQMQTWVNTSLGEPWRPYEKIDYGDLTLNREDYAAEVPMGVLVLTAGVDVQGNRLEYEIVGWGRDHESWSIEVGILDGDPGQNEVWDELTEKLTRVFIGEEKEFRVQCAFIDSGYHASQVYKFAKRNEGRRWFACKGMGDPTKPIISKATWVGSNPKVRMIPVGANAAKDKIFSFLKIVEVGPGFCHFPNRPEYDDAYLKQLCAEKKVLRARLGQTYYVYEKVSVNARNEALDLRVYATAARVKLNPNYDKIARRRLVHTEPVENPETPDETPPTTPTTPPTPEQRRKTFRVVNTRQRRF
ncbi:MAG TPA: terminase gpA endonuclease subunit, partial [Pyrinomonadaceae bacterium]|nr:terminase gpA endonuclease subunit [Pyrinomonadaceae bacterium]